MNFIYTFLIENGINPALATSFINAFYGTLLLMVIILLHRGYLAYRDIKKAPTEELTEDEIEKTVSQTMNKYGRGLSLLTVMTYLILFAADYFIISMF